MDHGGTLTVKVKHAEHTIDIYIEDTGVGIDPEIQDEIFKPFFTTKKSGEGSGLGLDIVKKIIEKHNASIDFESELDTGTKFIVKIPIHGEQE
jgi:signal transduction histidine kinase